MAEEKAEGFSVHRADDAPDTLHWCASMTIVLSGFTFVSSRINGNFNEHVFPVWAAIQIAVFAILLLLPRMSLHRRRSILEWVSPLRMCVIYIVGVIWHFAADEILPQEGYLWLAGVIPSAVCMSAVSAMGLLYAIEYCAATSEERFWRHAAPGSLVAAFLVFFPISDFPLAATIMCCIVAIVWYIGQRRLSPVLTEYETVLPEEALNKPRLPSVAISATALFFAGGMICPLVMNPYSLTSDNYTELYVLTFVALAVTAICIPATGYMRGIYSHARACAITTGCAYCFLAFMGNSLMGVTSAVLLGCFAMNASVMLYALSQHIRDPRASWRFGGFVMLVFLAFFAGMAAASVSIHASGDSESAPFVVLSLCACLFFIVLFREAWPFGESGTLDVRRVEVTPMAANSSEEDVRTRCSSIVLAYGLTSREAEILTCLSEGWSVPVVARRLSISQDTARTHVKHIYQKLSIHSRDELVEIMKTPDEKHLPKSG